MVVEAAAHALQHGKSAFGIAGNLEKLAQASGGLPPRFRNL